MEPRGETNELKIINKIISKHDAPWKSTDTANGKIYMLKNNKNAKLYIGSTCDTLNDEFMYHLHHYNTWRNLSKYKKKKYRGIISYRIFMDGMCHIELIENYPCESMYDLRKREGDILRKHASAVNSKIPGRTSKQWKKDNKKDDEDIDYTFQAIPCEISPSDLLADLNMF